MFGQGDAYGDLILGPFHVGPIKRSIMVSLVTLMADGIRILIVDKYQRKLIFVKEHLSRYDALRSRHRGAIGR